MHKLLSGCALALCAWLAFSQDAPTTNGEQKKKASKKGLPLKPERKIEFNTDEGTWMSVDVAPDGKSLVFDLAGDLYSLPMEGGEAKLLIGGMGYETQPKLSPDGKYIAFVSDRDGSDNLYVADADGKNIKQLSRDQQGSYISPSWTLDSEYVAVSKRSEGGRGSHEVFLYHVKGGTGVQVTKSRTDPPGAGAPTPASRAQSKRDLGVVPSPDGKFFYFARRLGEFNYNMTLPVWQIVRRDRVTGDEDTITSEVGSAFRPVISPDGKQMTYLTRRDTETELRLRDLSTGEEKLLKRPVQRDDQESRAMMDVYPGYVFTPDGSAVVISYGGKIHKLTLKDGEDHVIPFQAKVSLDLGPRLYFQEKVDDTATFRSRLIQQPQLSPDGKRLAFSSMTHLFVRDVDGGTPKRLTTATDREYQPAWSPDGQWIAYSTWARDGGQLWKMRADGSGSPVQLTRTPAYYSDSVWSPDGEKLVALRGTRRARMEAGGFGFNAQLDLVWVSSNGGDTTLIVPSRGLGRPHFASDPQRIFVNSSAGLISIRFDGTDRRTHLKVVGKGRGTEPETARDVRMHPSMKQVIAHVNNQLWLVTVPALGGEAPTVNVSTPSVPVKRLTDLGADSLAWADGGKTIIWSVGSTLFRQPLDKVSMDQPVFDPDNPAPRGAVAKIPPTYTETDVVVDVQRPRPSGSVVLRGAKLITMKGDEVIPDSDVVITDNRIAAAGKRGTVTVPQGAKIIDVKGTTIMPGIVDTHAHWSEIKRGILDMEGWPYLANLAYGVTSGRDPQTGSNDAFAYQDLIDSGEMMGPRAFSTGPGIFSDNDFQSLDDAMNVVTRYKKYYRTNTVKSYTVGNRRQRQWMVEACKANNIMPTTEGALDYKLDFTHAIDGFAGNEHALPIVPLYKDSVQLFSQSGIFYTPTLLVAYGGPWAENYFYTSTEVYGDPKLKRFFPPSVLYEKAARRPWFRKEEHVFPKLAAEAAKIARAGGRVQVGGHGQIQGIQCHWEMWALATGGMTNMEVLRSATINGAEAIGFMQDLGSIEAGKLADLIILNKDPLADIRNTNTIRYVMKNGELFAGDTLAEIWPKEKPAPELWWHREK